MKTKNILLGLLAPCFIVSAASAQGLIGVQYAEVGGGYARLSGMGESIDGWGAGVGFNTPIFADEKFGVDFNPQISYLRLSESGLTVDSYGIDAVVRGYAPLEQPFTPFAEIGLGWSRAKATFMGQSATDSGFTMPLGVGIEFVTGAFSLAPFYNYIVGLDSDLDDSWAIGAKAAYWFNSEWALTLEAAHLNLDDDFDGLTVIAGFTFAF